MNKSIKLINRYPWPRCASGALALGAALLVAPLGVAQEGEDEEEIFELSPFSVDGSDDAGYRAASTLAGTRIRTNLKDVGSAISVVTEEFLRDTSATDNESLLIYTTGTEVGGIGGNFAGGGDGGRVDTDTQRLRPNQATRVRGLAAADNTRDFFITDIPWDSYITDRIDLQRGPNSILFGLGSPAGVINATTNTANYETGGEFQFRFGSHDSWRASINWNQEIIEDTLAIRVAALSDNEKFKQDGAFEDDERYFVALKWEPKFLSSESSSTTFAANYESGDIDANRPRVIPPIDRITPWFTDMGKATYTAASMSGVGPTDSGSPDYDPWLNAGVGRIFDGPVAVFDRDSSDPSYYFMAQLNDARHRGIDSYDSYAKAAGLENSEIGVYKSITLSDPSVFDFYNKLIDGPNKSEWQKWDAYNFTVAHNMMDNKLGIELAFNVQEYEDGQTNLLDNAGQSISVDIMETLPDGSPNPNLGRAYIGGDAQNNFRHNRDRETFRATAYYDLDFRDFTSESLGNALGRHVFTGVYSDYTYEQKTRAWIRNTIANGGLDPSTGDNASLSITQASRYVANMVYLGDSLMGASSASGANIPGLIVEHVPQNGYSVVNQRAATDTRATVPLTIWSADNGDIANLYKSASYSQNKTESKALVWQGFLFDGLVVPMFGYREDEDHAANAGNVPNVASVNGAKFPDSPSWTLPGGANEVDLANNKTYNSASGINRTHSLVVHTPRSWTEGLPGGMNFSLSYTESANFRPDASRRDLLGNPLAPTSGETEEYGFSINGWNDRFNLKINKYKTKVFQDTLSAESIGNSYMIGAGEGWGYMFANQAANGLGSFANNYALEGPGVAPGALWDHDADATTPEIENVYTSGALAAGITELRYQPKAGQTAAQALAEQEAAIAAIMNESNHPPAQFLNFWNQDWAGIKAAGGDGVGGLAWDGEPGKFAITGDTVSEGWEYELFMRPTDNWNIAVNASKTEARRLNVAESYATFVEGRNDLYGTAYGDVRLWGGASGAETIRGKYRAEFYSNYTLFRLLNESNVPELRPWRANLITNYSFTDGKLAGLNVGGAWRWQDEVVVGYRVIDSPTGVTFDVNNPYMGSAESNFDLWAGYSMALSDNIDWRIQLNVQNVGESAHLIPITVQPDGTPATSRIAEGSTWTLSNTFSF